MLHKRLILVLHIFILSTPFALYFFATRGYLIPYSDMIHGTPQYDANLPFQPISLFDQFTAVGTFFGVKSIYTILSAALIALLWDKRDSDLAALRWSLIAFFLGEACCFFNVMIFNEHSRLLEHLHSAGMVLTFAYATYALIEFLDRRVIHYSDDARCSFVTLCRGCIKHSDTPCGLRRLFMLLIPATAIIAAIPLASPFRLDGFNTTVFHMPHVYRHPVIHQYYELRYLPIVAIVLLAASLLVLLIKERYPVHIAKILFAAAAGAIGFSWFRLVLVAVFVDHQVFFGAWEELTELLFIALVGGILLVFRHTFFPAPATAANH